MNVREQLQHHLANAAYDVAFGNIIPVSEARRLEAQRLLYRLKSAVAALDALDAGSDPQEAWERWAHPRHPWPVVDWPTPADDGGRDGA